MRKINETLKQEHVYHELVKKITIWVRILELEETFKTIY